MEIPDFECYDLLRVSYDSFHALWPYPASYLSYIVRQVCRIISKIGQEAETSIVPFRTSPVY